MLLAAALLALASSVGRAEPPSLDFSAYDGVPAPEQKLEEVRRELLTKFPIGAPVTEFVEALQRPGNRSGGYCQLRVDMPNTHYCERDHLFARDPRFAIKWVVSIVFDPATQTTTEYRVSRGTNIFLPEYPPEVRKRLGG